MTGGFLQRKYNKMYAAQLMSWTLVLLGTLSDSIIGGLCISEDAVAATGLVQPIYSLVVFLASFVAVGTSTVYSTCIGAFDRKKAETAVGLGLIGSLFISAVSVGLMLTLRESFFDLFDVGAEVRTMATEYYNGFILMMALYPVYLVFYDLVIVDGGTTVVVVGDLAQGITNAVFSLLLVKPFGVRGLAYGTVLGLLAACVPLIYHYASGKSAIRLRFDLDRRILGRILASGSTMSFTQLYTAAVDIVMNKFIIESFGESFLPAYAVIHLLMSFAQVSISAADSAGVFISVSYGEENAEALRRIMKLCTKRTFAMGAGMAVFFFLLAPFMPKIYGIETPEVAAAAVYITRIASLSYFASGFVYEYISYFPRVEQPFLGNMAALMYLFVFPLLLPITMKSAFGLAGFAWGYALTPYASLAVTMAYLLVVHGPRAFPFAIGEEKGMVFHHEFAVVPEEIAELARTVGEELRSAGVDSRTAVKAELVLEETLMIVYGKNGEKQTHGDCTVTVSDKEVRLIACNDGVIFDITQEAEDGESLRHYVTAQCMTTGRAAYLLTASYNRASFCWSR